MIQTSSGYFQEGLISGAAFANLHYPVTGGFVYNLFDTASAYWYDNATSTTTNDNFITGSIGTSFPTYSVVQPGNYQFRAFFDISSVFGSATTSGSYHFRMIKNSTVIHTSSYTHNGGTNLWSYLPINVSSDLVSLNTTDKVSFILQLSNFNSNNFTASISSGSVYCLPVTSTDILYTINNSITPFISGSIDGDSNGINDTFVLSPDFNSIVDTLFNPSYTSGSVASSSLYNKYGDVVYSFNLQKGDLVLFKAISSTGLNQYEYRVSRFYVGDNGLYHIHLDNDLPAFLNIGAYTTSSFEEVLFLKQLEDETQVLLNFNKKDGRTSYGFIIPEDIHPDILKNINTITKEVKTKLIEVENN